MVAISDHPDFVFLVPNPLYAAFYDRQLCWRLKHILSIINFGLLGQF